MPASGLWPALIAAFFAPGGESSTMTDVSLEFDYHNACDDHWREAAYPVDMTSGMILNCPR